MKSMRHIKADSKNIHIQSLQSPALAGIFLLASSLLVLTACSSQPKTSAPVEEQSHGKVVQSPVIDSKPLPSLGSAQAGKAGYYTVKPGDTIMQVGRNTGQNWRDIVLWNHLENPSQIEVGQVLRVATPESTTSTTATNAAKTTNPPAIKHDHAPDMVWPSNGKVIATYDGVKNKGLKMAGKLGDPVIAAASGRVVVASSSLRGYGNMVIIKHNEDYLTAYAHNQKLLVKEDQIVQKGQKIASMGSSDADRVMLHFEVRHLGKPVDPVKYLPSR